mmetsp:Transcript_10089/g.14697  ORF Transcript_10089/g.14697 Transcript_10089/m.14697 type:complete len:136 (+) Transcript_10089:167-574(+)|eukprot:CAMPEP_0175098706 /NCGR_PEP_ID=MMETSP0086_2-20121207/6015_1 /TAXON_ID=136419 /ORGANISM="Unknown Unknown, Strain D1" /LENGTH=135 /DNA_ID=CAMNT_0016372405 /DNA_START=167 /DNA_END=574 /DNA_ORIENTATION=+
MEVYELFADLAALVDDQQTQLDVIEARILSSKRACLDAEKQLIYAAGYQTKGPFGLGRQSKAEKRMAEVARSSGSSRTSRNPRRLKSTSPRSLHDGLGDCYSDFAEFNSSRSTKIGLVKRFGLGLGRKLGVFKAA